MAQITLNSSGVASNGSLLLQSNGTTTAVTIDTAQNMGLGVTPSAWGGSFKALQVGLSTSLYNNTTGNGTFLGSNFYWNGSNNIYINSNFATAYGQTSGSHQWFTAATGTAGGTVSFTQAMTLDADGDLGIGTTSPAQKLHVAGNVYVTGDTFRIKNSASNTAFIRAEENASTAAYTYATMDGRATGYWAFSTNDTERARIDSSGNLLVGTTSQLLGGKLGVLADSGGNAAVFKSDASTTFSILTIWGNETTGNQIFTRFATDSNAERGSITYNRAGGLVAYNVTSDYRAKDIYGPVTDSGALIDSVPVYMGKMKGATQERPMFIAHEVPAYAHTGEKDAVDADGNPVYQQMDASALIPVMWAEIQSLRQRLAAAGI